MSAAMDLLREMAGAGRVSSRKLEDALAEIDPAQLTEWGENMGDLAEGLEQVAQQRDEWAGETSVEAKNEAREELLSAMDEAVTAWDTLTPELQALLTDFEDLEPTDESRALDGLRMLYRYIEPDNPDGGPSGADTCQALYALFEDLGWKVP